MPATLPPLEPDPLTKHDAAAEFVSGVVCDCPTCANCTVAWGRLLSQLRYLCVEREELQAKVAALESERAQIAENSPEYIRNRKETT